MRHYNPVLHGSPRAWTEENTKRYKGESGGGGTSTTYTSNVPKGMENYAKRYSDIGEQQVFRMDDKGNIIGFNPYVPYSGNPADYVAGFSPLQTQSFQGASNLSLSPYFQQGADFATAAGMGGLESAARAYGYGDQGFQSGQLGQKLGVEGGGYYGNLGAQIGQMGLNAQATGQDITGMSKDLAARQARAGVDYASMATDPYVQQMYMSPYMQNVIENQKAAAQRESQIQNQLRQAQAARSGAFGGSRQAIEQAEADRALSTQLQTIEAAGLQTAYDKAIQSMQYGAGLGLQGLGGAQSGLGTALQGGQLGLSGIGTALQGVQTGLQGVGTQMQGTGQGIQGAQAGLQGVSGAQAGYGLANQAGANLANIGQLSGQQLQDILKLQNTFGAQQQQQQQNITNQAIQNYTTAQEFPRMQLDWLSSMLRGAQGMGQINQAYQAPPSALGTAAQLGTAALGAKAAGVFKEGGIVKLAKGGMVNSYADGGVTSADNVERIAQKLSAEQLQQALKNKTVPDYIGLPLLMQKQQEQQRMQMAQAAAQQGPQQSIKDQIMAQSQGVDALPSNLPVAGMAGGGIVAFAGGGEIPGYADGAHIKGVPPFSFVPEEYSTKMQQQAYQQAINPETGLPFTEEEIIAKQRGREAQAGIKDIYTPERERLEKEIGGLDAKKKEAFGLALMQGAFEGLAEGNPNAIRGIGRTAASATRAASSALKDIKDSEKEMRKQQLAMDSALQQFKQAQLSGDDAKIEKANNKYVTAATNLENAQNKNAEVRNVAGMKGMENEYDYRKAMDVANINARSSGANKLSDYETYLEGAKKNPANYITVETAKGPQQIFNIDKVTANYRGTDTKETALLAPLYDKLSKTFDEKEKAMISAQIKRIEASLYGDTLSAPAAGPRQKPLSAF